MVSEANVLVELKYFYVRFVDKIVNVKRSAGLLTAQINTKMIKVHLSSFEIEWVFVD